MHNAELLGGLIASVGEKRVFPDASGSPAMDLRTACSELRTLTEQSNLTNASLLASRRTEYARERQRAETIHEFKLVSYVDIREMYLRHEPALIAAIRKDDRSEARGILNRLLAAIYYRSGHRLDLVKSFLMELVVTMCRTAVEAGGHPESVFGSNFASIAELSRIESQEALAPWVHEMLERIMDAIQTHRGQSPVHVVSNALEYMGEHFGEDISRQDVARAAHVSPSHLSRMVRRHLGRTYTDVLNQMRVDRAAELLVRTDRTLTAVAFDTGFRDQSYFTKVFRRYTHVTPRGYRMQHRTEG
jgi:YesN/AraC family two-component response regulator